MGRPATGSIKWRKDAKGVLRWHARISLKNGDRPWVGLDPSIPESDEGNARRCAADASHFYRENGVLPETTIETVGEWFKRFHDAKEARGFATVKEMRGRIAKWVLPGIEHTDIRAVTREDIEAIVRRLDRLVAEFMKQGPGEGRLSPSTAANIWGDLQHAFSEAVRAKDPALRVLTENPCRDVRGPETGNDREGQILYSDELVTLLRGNAVLASAADVPLYRRQAYAMAIYTKGRASELEALTAADVDLVHGTITIAKQADRASKGRKATKATKTKSVRKVDIEPNVLPLVEHLVKHPQGKAGRLLRMPPPEDRALLLRRDLLAVGVTREDLHIEGDPQRRAIVFHDLRDTGLTHMAVRGDAPIKIQWAGGHTDFKTTQGYLDKGRVEARRIGIPLPPLPPELGFGSASANGSEPTANGSETRDVSSPVPYAAIANPAFLPSNRAMAVADSNPFLSAEKITDSKGLATEFRPEAEPGQNPVGPLTLDLLRRKLDAAIVAEAWDAVKAIRERMIEVERAAATNVISLPTKRGGAT